MRNIALIVAHAWLWVAVFPYALFRAVAGDWFERCSTQAAWLVGCLTLVLTVAWVVGFGLLVEWAMEGVGL